MKRLSFRYMFSFYKTKNLFISPKGYAEALKLTTSAHDDLLQLNNAFHPAGKMCLLVEKHLNRPWPTTLLLCSTGNCKVSTNIVQQYLINISYSMHYLRLSQNLGLKLTKRHRHMKRKVVWKWSISRRLFLTKSLIKLYMVHCFEKKKCIIMHCT